MKLNCTCVIYFIWFMTLVVWKEMDLKLSFLSKVFIADSSLQETSMCICVERLVRGMVGFSSA